MIAAVRIMTLKESFKRGTAAKEVRRETCAVLGEPHVP